MVDIAVTTVPVVCSESSEIRNEVEPFKFSIVENVYKGTQHNCLLGVDLVKRIVKYDDSNAEEEYYALNLKTWNEIDNHVIDNKRIGVGRDYGDKEAVVFIQVGEDGKTATCESYLLFSRDNWIELRKLRGKNKHMKMKISQNGTLWVGETYKGCNFRVFVKGDYENYDN